MRATSGADGRYRLVGMPGGPGNAITANPGPGLPYLGAGAEVPAGTAPEPAVVDFVLKRGVAIRGKALDKATGKPRPSCRRILLLREQPLNCMDGEVATGPDGSFELIGLPGRGLVAARATKDHYLVGQGAATIPGADEHGWFHTGPHICQPEFFHAVTAIDPATGTDTLTCDLVLDPGKSRRGTLLDPSGKPLAGCVAVSLCPATMSQHVDTLTSESFTAIALDPKHGRHLFFRHRNKKLAAVVMAQGAENGPLTVRLQPARNSHRAACSTKKARPRTGVVINAGVWSGAVRRHSLLFHPSRIRRRQGRAIPDRRADPRRGLRPGPPRR